MHFKLIVEAGRTGAIWSLHTVWDTTVLDQVMTHGRKDALTVNSRLKLIELYITISARIDAGQGMPVSRKVAML